MPPDDELVAFFKALADPNRLRIVGLLAHRPHAVEELATVLELRASTVSHHLARLATAGIVTSTARGHYHEYALDSDALQAQARSVLSDEGLKDLGEPVLDGLDAYDRKVIGPFLDEDGRIVKIPMKRKKFQAILRYALRVFDDEGPWDEREVNRRLKPITFDTATIRRGFIDHRFMSRDAGGTAYRRLTPP